MAETTEELKHNKLEREELHKTYAGELMEHDFNEYTSLIDMSNKIAEAEIFESRLSELRKIVEMIKQYDNDKK